MARKQITRVAIVLLLNVLLFYLLIIVFVDPYNNAMSQSVEQELARSFQVNQQDTYLKKLLKLLSYMDAFLVDYNLLAEISTFKNSSLSLKLDLQRFIENEREQMVSFGLKAEQVVAFAQSFTQFAANAGLTCSLKPVYSSQKKETLFLVACGVYKVAVHVFTNRGGFLYVDVPAQVQQATSKWFNDVPRGMKRFKLDVFYDSFMNVVKIPDNLQRYFYDYGHSRFLECNKELSELNTRESNNTYFQDKKKNRKLLPCLVFITMQLESMYKHYYLAAGSLLGWYRDCGIIPHTTDMDFAIYANEYEERIKEAFLGKPRVYLWQTLGKKRTSYELRAAGCGFSYDLFLMYKNGEKKQCSYYHAVSKVYPQCYESFSELCSAELLGHKVTVPCDPKKIIQFYYGETWESPKPKKYKLTSMLWSQGISRSANDLPFMYRYYSRTGELMLNKTLTKINEEYILLTKRKLTKLPPEEDEFM